MATSKKQYLSDNQRQERRAEMARALARGGMEGVHVLSLEQAEEVLTPKRQQIVEALSQKESRDLKLLAEHAIVSFDTDGRAKRPYLTQEHVVVEPIV